MTPRIDLDALLSRENAAVEWKRHVADTDDVVAKLVAFANDITGNVPEGFVVCGIEEARDEHGFPQPAIVGLAAKRLKEVNNRVLADCRNRVEPPIAPSVYEVKISGDPSRRVLVFRMTSSEHSHRFAHRTKGEHYWIAADESTVPARDRILRQLFRDKGELPSILEQPCGTATLDDIDMLAARQFLKEAGLPRPPEEYFEPGVTIDLFAHPLVVEKAASSGQPTPVPTYLALLLFGHAPVRFLRGAYVILSVYSGTDKTTTHSQRFETSGPLPKIIRDILGTLRLYTGIQIDKSADALRISQNRDRYSERALQEAVVNALVHREYESDHPTRITVFSNRIEIYNPGGLPHGISRMDIEKGRAAWRNEALARFLVRMGLAQAEGQGIPLILRETERVSGRQAELAPHNGHFVITLPAYVPTTASLRES